MADTANVCVEAISSNNVESGRAIVGVTIGGLYKSLDRHVGPSVQTAQINERLTGRFDNPNYYTGDSAS